MVNKNKRAKTQAPAKADRPPLWNHRLFPLVFFLALSLVYFYEFPLSDKIVFGMDVGTDYHKGAALSFWDKVQTVDQPMWDPKMGGFPQSEAIRPQYFPAYVLYFFTTFQRYIGWRYILTMCVAGLGMYAYLRQIHVGGRAALWGGVAFMSAPTFLAFPLAGHYAKMGVIALFPWIIWALERALAQGRLIYWAAVGVLIGACIYSHPPMTYFALLGLGVYFLFKLYQMRREWAALVRRLAHFIGAVVLGLALGAEGAFPVMLYTRAESKRATGDEVGGKTVEEQLAYARSWSLHPEEVASLVVPEFGGYDNVLVQGGARYWGRNAFKINSEYFGALAVLLALLMVPECRRRPQVALLAACLCWRWPTCWASTRPCIGWRFTCCPGPMCSALLAWVRLCLRLPGVRWRGWDCSGCWMRTRMSGRCCGDAWPMSAASSLRWLCWWRFFRRARPMRG